MLQGSGSVLLALHLASAMSLSTSQLWFVDCYAFLAFMVVAAVIVAANWYCFAEAPTPGVMLLYTAVVVAARQRLAKPTGARLGSSGVWGVSMCTTSNCPSVYPQNPPRSTACGGVDPVS